MQINHIRAIISEMTLEEKASLCSGKDAWHTKSVERLGIPSIMVSDGPHGLRKEVPSATNPTRNETIQAVCFPAACATGSSFDPELLNEMGHALGRECQAEDISILLGPGVNMKRTPLCGRNFEYFSEDPYVAGKLGAGMVEGVQSEGIGVSLKHFAGNNQEYLRMTISSEMDERTLREIYLPAFETVVKEAKPWTVMCSYNRLNGVYASENKKLLTDILRDEWGFQGFVMSDWDAVWNRVAGVRAGLELEMPGGDYSTDQEIVDAVNAGTLPEEAVNKAVEHILNIVFRSIEEKDEEIISIDFENDHALAVKVESESAVLLKNENKVLPLSDDDSVLFLGEFAKIPYYQGYGSSRVNILKDTNAFDEVSKTHKIDYVKGYSVDGVMTEEDLSKAVEAAKLANKVVIFVGLPKGYETEGEDKVHIKFPEYENRLIEEVTKVQKHVIVVLHIGSAMEMPWLDNVEAVLNMYLGGQGVGEATAQILYGDVNPSGHLAETFPRKLEDNPAYLNYPGSEKCVQYKEGIFIGYRYYDKKKMDVLFPFGHGLSYTKFAYKNLALSSDIMINNSEISVLVDVTNTGERAGKEVVQLYISDLAMPFYRPVRELKGFQKILLAPQETKTVRFTLDQRAFSYYNKEKMKWECPSGEYAIQICKNSRDVILSQNIKIS